MVLSSQRMGLLCLKAYLMRMDIKFKAEPRLLWQLTLRLGSCVRLSAHNEGGTLLVGHAVAQITRSTPPLPASGAPAFSPGRMTHRREQESCRLRHC